MNRSAKPGSVLRSGARIFSATNRLRAFCRALYTTPMPPRPRHSRISNWGKCGARAAGLRGSEGVGVVPPGCVGAIAAEKRHRGQGFCEAAGSRAEPHRGQWLAEGVERLMHRFPDGERAKGYRDSPTFFPGPQRAPGAPIQSPRDVPEWRRSRPAASYGIAAGVGGSPP